jgi:Domain of unknown function (DUF4202)
VTRGVGDVTSADSIDLDQVWAAIDAANAEDPNTIEWHGVNVPRSLIQGQRASCWLSKIAPDAGDALRIAARAHHLRRWAIARADYAEGRPGYLKWRRELKAASAASLNDLLEPLGVLADVRARAGDLVQRVGLGTDPDAQAVEDVACLVFLETDFVPLLAKIGRDKTADAVRKTLKKMSPEAIALGVDATPDGPARALLVEVASR